MQPLTNHHSKRRKPYENNKIYYNKEKEKFIKT